MQKETRLKLDFSVNQFVRFRHKATKGSISERACAEFLTALGCVCIRETTFCPAIYRAANGKTYAEGGVLTLARKKKMNIKGYYSPRFGCIREHRMDEIASRLGMQPFVKREVLPSIWVYDAYSEYPRQLDKVSGIIGLNMDNSIS